MHRTLDSELALAQNLIVCGQGVLEGERVSNGRGNGATHVRLDLQRDTQNEVTAGFHELDGAPTLHLHRWDK